MPDDEAASRGGWQVRGEPWDLLVPPPEQPLVQLSTRATSFSQPKRTAEAKLQSYSSPSSFVSLNKTFAIGMHSCKTPKKLKTFAMPNLAFHH